MATLDRGRGGVPEEERLPWLEELPDEERPGAARPGWWLALLLLVAVSAGGWALYRWWAGGGQGGAAGLIRAPEGPYKIRPADPGGMDVEGEGYAAYSASEGGDPRGAIDLSAMPEAPVTRGAAPAAETPGAPADALAAGIQLGAFSSNAKAEAAWTALAQRFAYLAPLNHVVLVAKIGDGTVYRLRAAAGPQSAAYCGRLKVAGETCLVVPG